MAVYTHESQNLLCKREGISQEGEIWCVNKLSTPCQNEIEGREKEVIFEQAEAIMEQIGNRLTMNIHYLRDLIVAEVLVKFQEQYFLLPLGKIFEV